MNEMRELTANELDAVCGGGGLSIKNYVDQTNKNYQTAKAYGGWSYKGNGGDAIAANVNGDQTNYFSVF